MGYNKAAFLIHRTIHNAGNANEVVLHAHIPGIISYGRLFFENALDDIKIFTPKEYKPVTQEECFLGDIMTMPYNGIIVSEEQTEILESYIIIFILEKYFK